VLSNSIQVDSTAEKSDCRWLKRREEAMAKRIYGAALVAVLISACGGESETMAPPQAPPPPPPVATPPPPDPVPPPPEPPKPSLLELEKQAMRTGLEALNAHEAAKFAETFAPDGVSVTFGAAESKGREAIASDIQKFFDAFPDFKLAETNIFAKGEVVVAEWVMNGTHKGEFMGVKATGKPVGLRGATVAWLTPDGLVKQAHRYMDGATLMGQIGQSKAPVRPVPALPTGDPTWHVASGTPEEEKQTEAIKGMYSAFENKAEADFLAVMAENAVWRDVTMPKDAAGKAEAKKGFQTFTKAFPDGKLTVDLIFSADEFTIAETTMSGTHSGPLGPIKATKKPVTLHGLDVHTVREGKIQSANGYGNSVEFLAQAGLLPKPKAAKSDKPAPKEAPKTGGSKTDAAKVDKK
jgi:steroid delta-isomerase-like uncharacterized protein